MKEKEIRKKYLEFQILNQQINQIQEQINTINNNILELKNLTNNLEYISKLEIKKEVLIPLGANIFIKGSLKNNKEVIMGIGSNILKEKTITQSKETINEQIRELEDISLELENNLKNSIEKIENLEKVITKSETEK